MQADVLSEAVTAFQGDFKEAVRRAGVLQGEVAAFFGYVNGGRGGVGGGGAGGAGGAGGGNPPGDNAGQSWSWLR